MYLPAEFHAHGPSGLLPTQTVFMWTYLEKYHSYCSYPDLPFRFGGLYSLGKRNPSVFIAVTIFIPYCLSCYHSLNLCIALSNVSVIKYVKTHLRPD